MFRHLSSELIAAWGETACEQPTQGQLFRLRAAGANEATMVIDASALLAFLPANLPGGRAVADTHVVRDAPSDWQYGLAPSAGWREHRILAGDSSGVAHGGAASRKAT